MFRRSTRIARHARSLAYVSLLPILPLLPLPLAYRAARRMGRMVWGLDAARRDASTAALAGRLGVERAEAELIARRSFELRCCADLEDWLVPRLDKQSIGRVISFEGLDYLDAALARGKGAVLYSGHIWGSRLSIAGLGLLGYRASAVRRRREPQGKRDPIRRWLFGRYSATFETKLGGRILGAVDRRGSVAIGPLCVSALRRNEIVALTPDLLYRKKALPGDVDVSFLNGTETFRPGGAMVARATGAALLSFWVHRPPGLQPSRCVIGPPLDVDGDIRVAVEAQAAQMEANVRQDPACWSAWLRRSEWEPPLTRSTHQMS